jgi:hypothetical protein
MNAGLSRTLVALALVLLLGAVAGPAVAKEQEDPVGKLRAGISEAVTDPARAAKLEAAVDGIEAVVKELNDLMAAERAGLATLIRDPGSSRAAVDASLQEFNGKREALARRALASHAAFKALATADEWKKLKKLETEMLMYAATRSLGQTASTGKEG